MCIYIYIYYNIYNFFILWDNHTQNYEYSSFIYFTGKVLEVCNIDFFSGNIDRLVFLVSSLYLAYLPLNLFKKLMGRIPIIFTLLSNGIRILLNVVVFLVNVIVGIKDVITFQGWGATEFVLTTSLLKFSAKMEGEYDTKSDKITLGFFEDEQDSFIAREVCYYILCRSPFALYYVYT